MKLIPNKVSQAVARTAFKTSKHSPAILFVTGVVGFGATVVLASKATLKVGDELDHIQKDLIDAENPRLGKTMSEQEVLHTKAYIYAKGAGRIAVLYAPAVTTGFVSLACFTQSHRILTRRNAALGIAYAGLEKAYREYRARVQQEIGHEREREIFYSSEELELVEDTKSGPKKVLVKRHGGHPLSPYAVLFDSTNENWVDAQEFRFLTLKSSQKWCNRILKRDGHIFLNTVYEELGFDHTSAGALVGWMLDGEGDGYVDFGFEDPERADRFLDFVLGKEGAVWLDFNVDGEIWGKI